MWLKAQEKGIVLLVMQKALRSGCCLSLEQKQYIVNWSFEKTGFWGFRSKCCCKMTFCCGRLFPTVSECLPSRHCDRALRGQTDHDPVTSVSSKSACLSLSAHMLLRRGSLASFSFSAGCPTSWLTDWRVVGLDDWDSLLEWSQMAVVNLKQAAVVGLLIRPVWGVDAIVCILDFVARGWICYRFC